MNQNIIFQLQVEYDPNVFSGAVISFFPNYDEAENLCEGGDGSLS